MKASPAARAAAAADRPRDVEGDLRWTPTARRRRGRCLPDDYRSPPRHRRGHGHWLSEARLTGPARGPTGRRPALGRRGVGRQPPLGVAVGVGVSAAGGSTARSSASGWPGSQAAGQRDDEAQRDRAGSPSGHRGPYERWRDAGNHETRRSLAGSRLGPWSGRSPGLATMPAGWRSSRCSRPACRWSGGRGPGPRGRSSSRWP